MIILSPHWGATVVASWVQPLPTAFVEGAIGWLEIVHGI